MALMAVYAISHLYNNVVEKATISQRYETILRHLAGRNGQNRILILFTNNAEMRYGGGFIGSVGYINAQPGGKVEIDPIHSVYYYDHRLEGQESTLEPATPELSGLTSAITLRDSGVSLDWPTNAERAAKLFERESGKKVDSVVMLTPNVVREMLKVTGPIALSEYNLTVTHENFLEKVQLEVEAGGDKQAGKDPKTILGVLANTMLAHMFERTTLETLARYKGLATDMAAQKQLAVYSRSSRIEKLLGEAGLAGGLSAAEANYVLVADANVGANKSSPYIYQSIRQQLTIDSHGKATAKLVLRRHHTGQYAHQYIDPHDGLTKWLVGANTSFVKVALPYGSKLLSNSFDQSRPVYTEKGRSVVTFLSQLEPGATADYTLTYELPFHYNLSKQVVVRSYFEKPIGSQNQTVSQVISLPEGYKSTRGVANLSSSALATDRPLLVVFQR